MALVSMALARAAWSGVFHRKSGRHHHRHGSHSRKISRCVPIGFAMHSMQDSCRSSPDFKAFHRARHHDLGRGGSERHGGPRSRRP